MSLMSDSFQSPSHQQQGKHSNNTNNNNNNQQRNQHNQQQQNQEQQQPFMQMGAFHHMSGFSRSSDTSIDVSIFCDILL